MAREDLLTFLRSQPATVLADLLAELAADHDEVRKRLERMQLADSPAKLSASFGKQLAAWKRSRRFHDHGDAPGFAAKLEQWLNQVARELTPRVTFRIPSDSPSRLFERRLAAQMRHEL